MLSDQDKAMQLLISLGATVGEERIVGEDRGNLLHEREVNGRTFYGISWPTFRGNVHGTFWYPSKARRDAILAFCIENGGPSQTYASGRVA
jgi:hypothetical protein